MSEPDHLLGLHAQLACVWEVTARKPGNVHRFRDFADTSYLDFIASAAACGPVLAVAPHHAVGATVGECVRLTGQVCARNTNLGIVLLLAPLAKASPHPDHRADVERVLAEAGVADAVQVYAAIATARPGGLGGAAEQDVRQTPTLPLRQCMALARDRDLIARQYANGFAEVFGEVAPALLAGVERTGCLEGGILDAQLRLMAAFPDSLIARKLGPAAAQESADRAREVLGAGWPETEAGRRGIVEFDGWLRADGNARNPGTTADLLAAGLFVLLRQNRLCPGQVPWELRKGAP